jgi:hypothetical protein
VLSVQLRFRRGPTASLSALSVKPFYSRFALFGSDAWVELRDEDHPEASAGTRVVICRRGERPSARDHEPADSVLANLTAFTDAVEGRAPYPFTDDELIHNVEVLEAVVRSDATGLPEQREPEARLAYPSPPR